jgi:protein TonB
MKRVGVVFVVLLGCMFFLPVMAQDTTVVEEDTKVFNMVEQLPEFPGGDVARQKFLIDNVKYPKTAKIAGLQGTVIITFIIEPDGSVSNCEVQRSVHPVLDEEALRVCKMMPNWKPGIQRGKPVRVQYRMPITFSLEGKEKKSK